MDHHANLKIIISKNKFLAFKNLPFLRSVELSEIFLVQSSVNEMALWLFEEISCCEIHLLIFCSERSGVIGSFFGRSGFPSESVSDGAVAVAGVIIEIGLGCLVASEFGTEGCSEHMRSCGTFIVISDDKLMLFLFELVYPVL